MSLKQKKWQITKISNTARKNIKALKPELQDVIVERFEALQDNPFSVDIKRIEGKKNIFWGRIGDYRYYFRLDQKTNSIEILLLKSRGKIKQKTIERLS